MNDEIDIGNDHYIKFVGWHPNRELNPQYKDIPDINYCGCLIRHKKLNESNAYLGEECMGFIHFDTPEVKIIFPNNHYWIVESYEPLTVSPSLLCKLCGDHGFIKNGKWIKA